MVGIGPGGLLDRTRRAEETIVRCGVIIGYSRYLALIHDLTEGKEIISSGMTKEVERCTTALGRARCGEQVALISSGDPGVYGMAGLALELAQTLDTTLPIEIVPGIP
ncbi:MAG: SAM-dependent methyltransferase, partial [Syntrophales bacterium]